MKFIKRITRITTGRIESFLSEVDEPEKVLPQLAREMEQAVRSAASAEAKSLAALKSAQRKFDEVTGRSLRLERGAQLAVQQGDDALARDALAAQIQVEKDAATAKKELEASESAYKQASAARLQIESELEDLNRRRDEIIAGAKNAKIRTSLSASAGGRIKSGKKILDEVTKIEQVVEESESKIDILHNLKRKNEIPLELRLRDIERKNEIEKRLRQLKN